jgi:HD-GYP domain-containing protein (c-di-GMP phosphodiesterase class II)
MLNDAKEIAKTVKQHHEHVDGSGYPDGLNGIMASIRA